MDDGGQRVRERERDFCSLLWENDFPLFPVPRRRAATPDLKSAPDPEYSCWWHFTACGRRRVCRDGSECVKYRSPPLLLSLFALCLAAEAASRFSEGKKKDAAREREREREGWGCKTNRSGSLSLFSLPLPIFYKVRR